MGLRGDWEPGVQYNYGDSVNYEGSKYNIIQPHRSQGDWAPSVVPALWGRAGAAQHCSPVGDHQYQPAQQQAPSYQGYESSQPPPTNDQNQNEPPKVQPPATYQAPGGVTVDQEDSKKKWYDLDDDKKKLLVGGGLALGLGAIGAGFYAKKKHEKDNEEEKLSQAWEIQNWIVASRQRADDFFKNGPKAPTSWILSEAFFQHENDVKRDLIPGGHDDNGNTLFIARAPHDGGIQLGKYSPGSKHAVIGYAHDEIEVTTFEVLIGSQRGVKWMPARGSLEFSELQGARPVEGGSEKNGTPLAVARGKYKNSLIPGKASSKLNAAFVPYDDDEKEVKDYEVLCYL